MNSTHEYGIILTTVDSEAKGEKIATALIETKLAACINLFPIKSFYTWEGKLCRDSEYQLLIKTRLALIEQIITKINSLHDYDVSEIVTIPIVSGSEDYLQWLGKMTKS